MNIVYKACRFLHNRFEKIKYKNEFKEFGNHVSLVNPLRINGADHIAIEDNVSIAEQCWLAAKPHTDSEVCELIIKQGARIGDFNHIYATGRIIIERNALTANFVYISDNLHGYEDVNTPIKKQPIKQLSYVTIGEGCWIGEHVCIIGASVGKHSVIGANSVVTHDIPDYCVAVGSPARIIKRYNPQSEMWEKTDKDGNFITK